MRRCSQVLRPRIDDGITVVLDQLREDYMALIAKMERLVVGREHFSAMEEMLYRVVREKDEVRRLRVIL